ncbi:MAG: hypothetical protein WCD37_16635 [Chloroflexia bacterium]
MPLETFYATAAQLFFTLLGFWWVVVQFKRDVWVRDTASRRMSYAVSLHFLLPGVMCVVALLSEEVSFIWNAPFVVAGLFGLFATLFAAYSAPVRLRATQVSLFGHGAAIVLYALITAWAVYPGLLSALGFDVKPLLVEAILLVLLAVLGATLAWFLFMEPE